MITLDGSYGEGGGQILRTALSLSMVTGLPFTIDRIRAGRQKPGLLRQHLTAVQAAREICGGQADGAQLGATRLTFAPGPVRGGEYDFAIGTAGSCTLVLQTLLPALLLADAPSSITIRGGTHNPSAPPADFLQHAFLPLLARMGVRTTLDIVAHGFYPAGGGELKMTVEPVRELLPLFLNERGEAGEHRAESWLAAIPAHVAGRELAMVREQLDWPEDQCTVHHPRRTNGPGNVLMLFVRSSAVCEVFTGFGIHGVLAEQVALQACQEALSYLNSNAAVGEHLADQLLLPMALAGGGSFTTSKISSHCRTNMMVIEQFLPVRFSVSAMAGGSRVAVDS